MLLRTIFVALLLTTLGEAVVHGVHALAQTQLRRQALIAVRDEVASSATLARATIAPAIAAGADPRTVDPTPPPAAPACRLRTARGCALTATATIAFHAGTTLESQSPCPRTACTIYEQENDAVDEGRIATTITAQAAGAGGAVLARRVARLTFRTLRVAPYAAPASQADATLSLGAGPDGFGDDAGAAPNGTRPER
ncbi:MAG TPA: hypothetical protein VGF86_00960 [Candidatus Tumulicola sp.]